MNSHLSILIINHGRRSSFTHTLLTSPKEPSPHSTHPHPRINGSNLRHHILSLNILAFALKHKVSNTVLLSYLKILTVIP